MDLEHEARLVAVEERSKSNSRRVGEVEKRQDKLDDLVSGINALAVREERVEKDVSEIKKDVKDINSRPKKWQDTVIASILSALAGGLIGYFLLQIGIGG